MKAQKLIVGLVMAFMLIAGCKKKEKEIVDCFGESLEMSLHVNVNSGNTKQVDTEVRYWGSKTVSSVKWEYGDGSTTTTTGLTSSHTYASAGSYTVKARVTLSVGNATCEVDPTKTVTIQ